MCIRDSPIIEELISEGAKITGHDPMAYEEYIPNKLNNLPIILASSVVEAIKGADAALVVTGWDEYIKLSPLFFKKNMKQAVVIDGRRIYDKNQFIREGVIYRGIGL